MKKTLVLASVLAAVACTSVVLAQDGGHQGRPGQGGPGGRGGAMMLSASMAVMPPQTAAINRLCEKAQLSEAQLTKLDTVMSKNDQSLKLLQQKSAEANRALRAAVLASKYDESKVKALAIKAEKAEADIIAASIDSWTRVRSVLTADQAAKLQDIMGRQQQEPGQKRGNGVSHNGMRPDGVAPNGDMPGGPQPGGDGSNPPPSMDGSTPPPSGDGSMPPPNGDGPMAPPMPQE